MIPVEPHADLRAMAQMMRQIWVALIEQGFTEAQAMEMVCTMLTAQFQKMPSPPPSE